MALIKCTECGKEISTTAEVCPHCGYRTAHGRSITEAKYQLGQWIISIVLIVLGVVWVFGNFSNVMELYNDWHDSWYWQQWRFMTYLREEEATSSLYKLIFGFVFLIGGIIDMIILSGKVKNTNGNGFVANAYEKNTNVTRSSSGVVASPSGRVTAESSKRWECSCCFRSNPPAEKFCIGCGAKREDKNTTTVRSSNDPGTDE